MLHFALVYHMHQPCYRDLLTRECRLPWVRLHGTKDYLDMVEMLRDFPAMRLTFNLVPSLLEQIREYSEDGLRDDWFDLSRKPAASLTPQEKLLIRDRFFTANLERVIPGFPRYYELYIAHLTGKRFETADYRDLQTLFNLAWIDPSLRESMPELTALCRKERNFSEKDKQAVLAAQISILSKIIPAYARAAADGRIEITTSPFYHPILPLLGDTDTARLANPGAALPEKRFTFPDDARIQLASALKYSRKALKTRIAGLWPSEQGVSREIIPDVLKTGVEWLITDEAILFKSLNLKERDPGLLYQPHALWRDGQKLSVVFRDRGLSDLIGFVYHRWKTEDAVNDFMRHLEEISRSGGDDMLVTVALDGENAWEYYPDDGRDFLRLLYRRLCDSTFVKPVTIGAYLKTHPVQKMLPLLAAGSWVGGEFGKWLGSPAKNKAWELLADARAQLERSSAALDKRRFALAYKQMFICEGSDWFWWAGEDPSGDFEELFRKHLANFYTIINRPAPRDLKAAT